MFPVKEQLAALGLLVAASTAQAQFAGLDVRNDPAVDAAASSLIGEDVRVFRLFAAYQSEADVTVAGQIMGAPGFGIGSAFVDLGAGFFQVPEGGDTAPIPALLATIPELQFDSFVSINRFEASDDSTSTDPAFDFVDLGGPASEDFVTGGWFVTPNLSGPNQGLSEVNPDTGFHEVFLGQLTVTDLPSNLDLPTGPAMEVTSVFDGELTIFNDTGGGDVEASTVQFNPTVIPAPAAAVCITGGLVGVGRRRRVDAG